MGVFLLKNKYVMISGLAFSEEGDMEKLSKYAKEGWILKSVVGGFYKLKKDEPKDIIYSLDYQHGDDEYFSMFNEAGWNLVTSVGNEMHIFSAKPGTNPIYSDSSSELEKYIRTRGQMGKGVLYSLIIAIVLMVLLCISAVLFKPAFIVIEGLLIIDMIVFIFNFMPFLAYNGRIKQIKKYGKCNDKKINYKTSLIIDGFVAIVFLIQGITYLLDKKYASIIYLIIGILFTIASIKNYKKFKRVSSV